MFKAPVQGGSREDAILLDPALAPTFAAHQLAFGTLGARIDAPVGAQSYGNCNDINWNNQPSCFKCPNFCQVTYYSDGTDAVATAGCPRVSCPYATAYVTYGYVTDDYDGVQKHQYCYAAGGCNAQQALGYVQCLGWVNNACAWEY